MSTAPHYTGRILVTSGPTRAWLDRVRYISNTSSGMLGARIVDALLNKGVPVTHLYGSGSEQPRLVGHTLLKSLSITTVDDLIEAIGHAALCGDVGGIIHAMAVLDYVPEGRLNGKVPSGAEHWDVHLVKTPKVASIMRDLMPHAVMVGFKLEAGIADSELIGRAARIMDRYRLDLVVANDIDRVGPDMHEALLVLPDHTIFAHAHTKSEIAEAVADFMIGRLNAAGSDADMQ